ncbi:unnamed protein product [Arctogadus glacialis]
MKRLEMRTCCQRSDDAGGLLLRETTPCQALLCGTFTRHRVSSTSSSYLSLYIYHPLSSFSSETFYYRVRALWSPFVFALILSAE